MISCYCSVTCPDIVLSKLPFNRLSVSVDKLCLNLCYFTQRIFPGDIYFLSIEGVINSVSSPVWELSDGSKMFAVSETEALVNQ